MNVTIKINYQKYVKQLNGVKPMLSKKSFKK